MAGKPPVRYRVNEIFCAPQGEGGRQGEPSVFVRFTGCNLRCAVEPGPRSPGGFDCDTEFMSGVWMTEVEILRRAQQLRTVESIEARPVEWVVFTGGEPMLQLRESLVAKFHVHGWSAQIETNGTQPVPACIDYVTVSPKVAEHAIRQRTATEVKYVRGYGQGIPRSVVKADRYFISPAFDGTAVTPETLDWCRQLCRDNPPWELSVQMHKVWNTR